MWKTSGCRVLWEETHKTWNTNITQLWILTVKQEVINHTELNMLFYNTSETAWWIWTKSQSSSLTISCFDSTWRRHILKDQQVARSVQGTLLFFHKLAHFRYGLVNSCFLAHRDAELRQVVGNNTAFTGSNETGGKEMRSKVKDTRSAYWRRSGCIILFVVNWQQSNSSFPTTAMENDLHKICSSLIMYK